MDKYTLPVLDKGHARLVTWTHWNMPALAEAIHATGEAGDRITELHHLGAATRLLDAEDVAAVNAARTSFDRESSELTDRDLRLLRFLATAEPVPHLAPFRHAHVTLEVYAPLFVCRQWWKHVIGAPLEEGTPWSELSRRYVRGEIDVHVPQPHEWHAAPDNAKQGSGGLLDDTGEAGRRAADTATLLASNAARQAVGTYSELLEQGVAAEQARMVLPQNVYTSFRWSPSLQALANFLVQRLDGHAQHEIRLYAQAVAQLVLPIFPHALPHLVAELTPPGA